MDGPGGHTTGSVLVFVTLPSGKRYAFIGDLTWQLDGIQLPAERPLLLRKMADSDPEQVRRGLFKVVALAAPLGVLGGGPVRGCAGLRVGLLPVLDPSRVAWNARGGLWRLTVPRVQPA